jgi:hypothetical protein
MVDHTKPDVPVDKAAVDHRHRKKDKKGRRRLRRAAFRACAARHREANVNIRWQNPPRPLLLYPGWRINPR